jgi:hypothetical protein
LLVTPSQKSLIDGATRHHPARGSRQTGEHEPRHDCSVRL